MRIRGRQSKVLTALAIVLITALLMGCGLLDDPEQAADRDEREKFEEGLRRDMADQEKAKAEPDQALPSGQVLSVRVRYGNSTASQCQVRIDNERNGWYDEVEFWIEDGSPLGSVGKGYDDYGFGSEMFGKQLTQPEYYDPKTVGGEYVVTVTAGDGYRATAKCVWDGEAMQPALMSFSLD